MNKREREEIQQRVNEEVEAAELGWDYFKEEPDHMLVTVAHMASSLYSAHTNQKANVLAFLHGYQQARAKREEYLREQEMQITTEGRIFTAQLMREMRNCERLGAGTFHPGAKTWHEAMLGFRNSFIGCGGPVKASKIFARGRDRLIEAHSKHGACYLNCFASRKRSGLFDMISWRVAQHPIRPGRYEGILISGNFCRLARDGYLKMYGKHHAFMSWHALGRLYERWDDGTVDKAAAVIGCVGVAGMLMSHSDRHHNHAMNLAFEGVHCTGVMRYISKEHNFFDCLTVLPDEPKYAKELAQGAMVASTVIKFIGGDDPDPRGYAEQIPVLPFTREDYVTQEIKDRDI